MKKILLPLILLSISLGLTAPVFALPNYPVQALNYSDGNLYATFNVSQSGSPYFTNYDYSTTNKHWSIFSSPKNSFFNTVLHTAQHTYIANNSNLYERANNTSDWHIIYSGHIDSLVEVVKDNKTLLYGATSYGVVTSTDMGKTWKTNKSLGDVREVIQAGNTIFAATSDGVYKSVIGSSEWQPCSYGMDTKNVTAIEYLPNGYLIAVVQVAMQSKIYISQNQGMSWGNIFTVADDKPVWLTHIGNTAFVATHQHFIYAYNTQTFQLSHINPPSSDLTIAGFVSDGDVLYIAYRNTGLKNTILTSSDYGKTWHAIQPAYHATIEQAYSFRDSIFTVMSDGHLNWQQYDFFTNSLPMVEADNGLPAGVKVTAMGYLPSSGVIYAVNMQDNFYKTVDHGQHWSKIATIPVRARIDHLVFDPKTGDIYAGTVYGLYQSQDDGKSWHVVDMPDESFARIVGLAIDNNHLWVATADGHVMDEDLSEHLWNNTIKGLDGSRIISLQIAEHLIYVATSRHVYTYDRGQWVILATMPDNVEITSIAASYLSYDYSQPIVYIGTKSHGVYYVETSPMTGQLVPFNTGLPNTQINNLIQYSTEHHIVFVNVNGQHSLYYSKQPIQSWTAD